jgi:SAM-dependent methyltransferase
MTAPQPADLGPYSGVENLEVMQEAVNYNRYLLATVRRYASTEGPVLDFGAGTGTFALPMGALGFDVTALEPDTSLRRRLDAHGLVTAADLTDLPDGAFEYAYTLNVLEHIEDDAEVLGSLHAKLKPGGRLLIYVPAFPLLFTTMDAKVGHVRRYTRADLLAKVTAAGFRVDVLTYVDSLGFAATLLFKMIGSADGEIDRRMLKLYDRCAFPLSRALDLAVGRWVGKNLLLVAHKATARLAAR